MRMQECPKAYQRLHRPTNSSKVGVKTDNTRTATVRKQSMQTAERQEQLTLAHAHLAFTSNAQTSGTPIVSGASFIRVSLQPNPGPVRERYSLCKNDSGKDSTQIRRCSESSRLGSHPAPSPSLVVANLAEETFWAGVCRFATQVALPLLHHSNQHVESTATVALL